MGEPIDEQRARFRHALGQAGVEPAEHATLKLSDATGDVVMSLDQLERLVSPIGRLVGGRVTFRSPSVRAEGDTVVLTVEEPTVMLTRATAIGLLRAIVEALGGFEALTAPKVDQHLDAPRAISGR
jgi:hypothetical protein